MSSHGQLGEDAAALLRAMYDATADEDIVDINAVAAQANLTPRRLDRAVEELEEDQLIREAGLGGEYTITVSGRRRVEGRDQPPSPPPVIHAGRDANIISGSTHVQQATGPTGPDSASTRLRHLLLNPWLVTIIGGVIVGLIVFALTRDEDDTPSPPPDGQTVTVYNKVTSGPRAMAEDAPLRLFWGAKLCRSDACVAPGPGYQTGNKIGGVICQAAGERITNGNDNSRSDDRNPRLFTSHLWYGVSTDSGRIAYFSEVWAAPEHRGGLGLPDCASAPTERG